MKRYLCLVGLLFVSAAPVARAELITNGSFEMPGGLSPDTDVTLPLGDTTLVGWSIGGSGGNVHYINGHTSESPDFLAVDGTYYVSFNGGDESPGTFLSQSFDTIAGQQYAATFFVGRFGTDGTDGDIVSLTASALSGGGDILASLQAFPPGHGFGAVERLSFTATSATTTLRFTDTSLDTISVDVLLDNVAVVVVPEPASLALTAVGVLGLITSRRRRAT